MKQSTQPGALGEVLKSWRLFKEHSIRAAAKITGVHYATLSRLERGENVDGETLVRVLVWLFSREN